MVGNFTGISQFSKVLPRCNDVIYEATVLLRSGAVKFVMLIKMDALSGSAGVLACCFLL